MNKRFFSILLCLFVVLAMVVPVSAVEEEEQQKESVEIRKISVSTVEEFLEFAENCRLDSFSQNLEVTLEADIDLSGTSFAGVPTFSGILKGEGHKITGLSLAGEGSYQGLFRYLTQEALVRDLIVEGQICPGGSKSVVGAIAGNNAGSIIHCGFTGSVSGGDYVGGIAGKNALTGKIENCSVEGNIHGDHFVGGISGENTGVIRNCMNYATINTTPQQNNVEISDITMDTLMNSESANTVTDIGGISGSSNGVIRNCKNRGDVGYQKIGYNIGGIAGTQAGYISACINYGKVQGRKEVGGIVGQMEPVALIEFTEDTLQILQGQLDSMTASINSATANAQALGGQLNDEVSALRGQTQTAKDAVNAILPDKNDPQLPDVDTILAAQNSLSNAVNAMPGTVESIANAAQSTLSGITSDLSAIAHQLDLMNQTIQNGSEFLGGSITDLSDQDTPDLLTGKIENCQNYGSTEAELNVGGIAGAMAMENDMDVLEDWESSGETSLNSHSEIRAVVLNCTNNGTVTGQKQNVGGLVGWQTLGLVKNSVNTGKVDAAAAIYVGGVAGQSVGFLRSVCANCEVSGTQYLGGIAGSAMIVSDSLSQVKLIDGKERVGGILGWAVENQSEEEIPIKDNYYLPVDRDMGAIDGISYSGLAEPMDMDEFLALETLPDTFQKVKICFLLDNEPVTEILLRTGEDLAVEEIPQVPAKEGYSGSWSGIEQAQLTDIRFDMTFEAVYSDLCTTIESEETRSDGRPVLLLEGSFTNAATVMLTAINELPDLAEKQQHLESWQISTNETGSTARFLLNDVNTDGLLLFVRSADGQWLQRNYQINGSYIVFSMDEPQLEIALVRQMSNEIPYVVGIGAVVLILLFAGFFVWKRKGTQKKEICAE